MKLSRINRLIHRWGSIAIALPVVVVIASGLLLQLKKQSDWVQPPTKRGDGDTPALTFDQILSATQTVPEAAVTGWQDIDRLDVRPAKGVIKVRCENRYEIQLDATTAEVLQVAYRRSDLIEAIHDGSWFHDAAKLWVFLPSGVILFVLWITGLYLFVHPLSAKRRNRRRRAERASAHHTHLE